MSDPETAQSQDSLNDQLKRLVHVANSNGLYDAADWLPAYLARQERDKVR